MAMAGHLLAGRLTQPGGFPRFDLGSGAQACRGAAGGPGMCGGQRRGGAARSLSLHRRPAAAAGPRGDARLPRRPPPSPLPVSGARRRRAEGRGAAPPPGRVRAGAGRGRPRGPPPPPSPPRRPQPMEPRRGGRRCSPSPAGAGGAPAAGRSAREASRTAAKWHLSAPGGGGPGHPQVRQARGTRRKAALPARGGRRQGGKAGSS